MPTPTRRRPAGDNRSPRARGIDGRYIVAAAAGDAAALAFSAPVQITAAAAGADGQPKGQPRFDMTAYTGGPMRLKGWQHPVVVDLQGVGGMDRSRPILSDHDTSRAGVVGHTDRIEVKDGKLAASGVISGAGAAAAEVRESGKNGFPWQASIGARVLQNEFVPEGKTAMANGQVFQGPVNIARRTALGEISFVALGADDNTSARVAASGAAKGSTMNFEQWLEARGFSLGDLSDAQKKSLQAAFDAEKSLAASAAGNKGDDDDAKPAKTPGSRKGKKAIAAAAVAATQDDDGADDQDDDEPAIDAAAITTQIRAEAATERKRISAITKVCAGKHDGIEAKAIEEGWTAEKAELEVLRASRPSASSSASFGINTGAGAAAGQPQLVAQAISAAASITAGVSEKVAFEGLKDPVKELAASRQFRGIGLHQVMFIIAQANGIPCTPGRVDDGFLRAMLYHDHQQMVRAADGAGFSTMSLSGITENILNKAMLEAYGAVESIVGDICYETDTNDFKTYKRYRLTGSGAFQDVGPNGELKNMSLQDEAFSNKLGTKGTVIQIGREMLINDDMGALTQIPQLIGRQAAIAREKAVITVLVGNANSFFSAGNKNLITGGTSALSITSMASARQKFLEQKDANGDPIMVVPDRILVPPALETTADNLFQGANLVVTSLGSTASKATEPNLNAHKGKYRPIVSPFLGAASPIAGQTDTAWHLLANPAGGMATVQIGYLRGQRVPVIERGEANFNTLGIAMRGFYDFGVAQHDNRCGVRSDGA